MTLNQVLAIAAVIVPASTAFLVAYWHRKQLRQLEAYKRDPSVGLTPPPSPLWRFVTSRRKLLIGAGLPAIIIALQFRFKAPVTLGTVLLIAFNVTSIVLTFLLELVEGIVRVIGEVVDAQKDILDAQAKHVQITEKVVSTLRRPEGTGASGA